MLEPPIPLEYRTSQQVSSQGHFKARRGRYYHTGVDLYTSPDAPVHAMADGVVVGVEKFTGPDQHPGWRETMAVLVLHPFSWVDLAPGVVVYGEVDPMVVVGDPVTAGQQIATVTPVLASGQERPDIEGHSRWMLHLEFHAEDVRHTYDWLVAEPEPSTLRDPYQLLALTQL
tara:strand:+ start:22014 stop:22529 length:516 start_codon:yes stop_codon:yes gene_type:complete